MTGGIIKGPLLPCKRTPFIDRKEPFYNIVYKLLIISELLIDKLAAVFNQYFRA